MRLTKFGKALCMGALSAGVVFGITSCVESYTVGFLYVTGTVTASTGSNGIISGFKIDHNTGRLATIDGLPIASGGANPVRAVLTLGSRFLYVLNRGASSSGSADCYGTGANECVDSNITQFAVGGNGILTAEETFYTSGLNPFRLIADSTGSYLMVLDHDAPDNASPSSTDNCEAALGTLGVAGGSPIETCGDITIFKIDQTTGRLSLVVNSAVTSVSNNNQPITYFPVPANPVDFTLSGSTVLTLTGAATPSSYPYTGATTVWPYTYAGSTGQLTISENSVQTLQASAGPMQQGTAIVNASGVTYVLDNEPYDADFDNLFVQASSQLLPFTVATNGTLDAEPGGIVPGDSVDQLSNPIDLIVESKGQYLYVANQGNNVTGNNPESGISGYDLHTSPNFELTPNSDEPWGAGSGPQCIVEDPSDQYIFEANAYSSNVTGRTLEPETGDLDDMRVTSTYTLDGPATWCLVDGRTG